MSGGFYIFGAAYLASPLFGWHMDSASMAAAFGAWPLLLKLSINGLRHLTWDTGKTFNNATTIKTGWAVVGVTFVGAAGLAFLA